MPSVSMLVYQYVLTLILRHEPPLRRGGVTAPYHLVAIRCHRGLVAEDVIRIANRIGCAALVYLGKSYS